MNEKAEKQVHTGYVCIIGRPNVGKSTLLNCLLAQKISIVSRKPQTTRHHLLGIKTGPVVQIIYIDTPGLQQKPRRALNRYMNRQATSAIADINIVLFVVEAMKWTRLDEHVSGLLKQHNVTTIFLVINKINKIANRERLLPFIESITDKLECKEVVLLSAGICDGTEELEKLIVKYLPLGPALYPDDIVTDRNERFFAAEFLREKLLHRLGDEVPYKLAITIDEFKLINNTCHIHAYIWVEKASQKSIVIGKQGRVLRAAGREARLEMENFLGGKVNLKTWVKVKSKWTNSEQALKTFGYND